MPTTYNLISDTNYDTLCASTLVGTDIYNINGAVLTVDTDTRYCSNHMANTGNFGSTTSAVTISTSLGGQLKIDGTNCKMIPYAGGSGAIQDMRNIGLFANSAIWSGGTATFIAANIVVASCTTTTAATTCTRATGSFITDGVVAGMLMTGTGIAAYTYVQSVNSATSITTSQNVTTGGTINIGFNKDSAFATGNRVTISNAYPPAWNGTYDVASATGTTFTVAMASDPGTIIQMPTVTRKYMVSQAIVKTPASTASYTISGAGPYTITVALPNHDFQSNISVVIAGSTTTGTTMNGTWTVTLIDPDTFSFSMPTSPVSVTAAGTITRTCKAEQLSVWNANTAISTGHLVAATGSGFTGNVQVTHALQAGDYVVMTGFSPAALNGTYKVESITTTTFFTYIRNDNPGNATVQGFVSCPGRQLTMAAGASPWINITPIGFLKVKNITNGDFEYGTLTLEGGAAPVMTGLSDGLAAPMEVVGPDTGRINIPRQGKFLVQGAWFYQPIAWYYTTAMTTSGTSGNWTVTVTTAAYSGGAAQVHRLYVGQEIEICGIASGYHNGRFRVLSCPTPTTFTYLNTAATTLGSATTQGTVLAFLCTSGVATRQNVLPIVGAAAIGGIWVEKYPFADPGDGRNSAYDFYPSMGTFTTAGWVGVEEARGKVCWIATATGIFRIGHDGTNVQGYLPPPGCKIRYGNIFTVGVTAATPATNTLQATLNTRFGFVTTSAGYFSIDKCNLYWQPTLTQPYYVGMTNSTIVDQILMSEIAAPIAWDNVHVAPSAVLATTIGCSLSTCFGGGTISNSSFTAANSVATSTTTGCTPLALVNMDNFAFSNCAIRSQGMGLFNTTLAGSGATPYPSCAIYALNLTNFSFNDTAIVGSGKISISASSDIAINNTKFAWAPGTYYNATVALSSVAVEMMTKSNFITVNGFDWPSVKCTSTSCTTNVVTVTTEKAHRFAASSVVDVRGCLDPTYNAHSVTLSLVTRTTASCTTVIGDNSVTTTASYTTSGVQVGDWVTGTGIPTNTYVESIQSATVMKMTNAATAAGAVTLTFNPLNQFTYPKTAANAGATAQTTMTVNIANLNQPLTSMFANTNSDNIKIRNIGSYYNKLNLGTNSASTYPGYLYNAAMGTSGITAELKRIYVSPLRTAVINSINSLSKLTVENVHTMKPYEMTSAPTSFTASSMVIANLSSVYKGCSWYHTIPTTTTGISVYGAHWLDVHVSTNDSQIHILGNEASALTTAQAVETGTNSAQSGFNSVGAFVMPKVGDEITWTTPDKLLGHTGFCTTPSGIMSTATIGTATVPGTAATLTISASSWAALTISVNTHTNTTVDGMTNTDMLYPGCPVTGSGFQNNTVIVSVDSASSITISLPTTTTLTGTAMTYSGEISFTTGTHRLSVGDTVMVAGSVVTAATWYGVYTVSAIISATVFRVKCFQNPGGTAPTAGTVTVPYVAITGIVWTASVATVTTSFAHGFLPGDVINIRDAVFTGGTVLLDNINGLFTVVTTPSLVTFTIAAATSPGTTHTASTGTIVPADNIKLAYDIDNSGTFKPLRYPIYKCNTPGTGNGVVYCSDTTNVAAGDWVYGNCVAIGGAKVSSVNANVSFTLARNNNIVSGTTASTIITSFTAYATRAPGQVLPAASTGFQLKVRATTIKQNSVAQLTNATIFSASTSPSQAYQYTLDLLPITLNNVIIGSRYRIDNVTTGYSYITDGTAASSTITGTFAVSAGDTIRVRVREGSSYPKYQNFETLSVVTSTGVSVYVSQVLDTIVA